MLKTEKMWMTLSWKLEVWQLLLSAALVLFLYLVYDRKYGKYCNLPPRVPGLPFFGNIFQIRRPEYIHMELMELGKIYGDIFTITLFGQHMVSINSGEMIANMVDDDVFPTRSLKSYVIRRILKNYGDISVRETGQTQRQLRTTVMKALSECESRQPLLKEEAVKLAETLLSSEGRPICVSHELTKSIANVLTVSLIGKRYNEEELEQMLEFGVLLDILTTPGFGVELTVIPFLRWVPVRSMKYIQAAEILGRKYIEEECKKAMDRFDPENVHSIVDRVIELTRKKGATMPDLTDGAVKGVMFDMYQAGWSTSSAMLNALIIALLNLPEEQRRLQKEVDSVVGPSRVPTLKDREEMPYTQAFIAEGLRLFSVGSTAIRAAQTDVHYYGYFFPKGTLVIYNVWAANHDPDMFEEPWSFKTERYLDDEGRLLPPGHLIWKRSLPFGEGKRSCLGQVFARDRLFIYIATLLQRLSFLAVDGVPPPSYDPRTFKQSLIVYPHPFEARVLPRN